MPRDWSAGAPTAVRRADRAVDDDAWIRATLDAVPFGTLATVADGRPFLNANLFVYDAGAHAIYLHTARVGRTAANVDAGAPAGADVCFGVFRMGRLLPAPEALEFSVEYEGVTAFGRAHHVEDPAEAARALQLILARYAPHLRPGRDYRGVTDEELARTAVWRVDIESWVGKRKAVDADFPGAFVFEPEVNPTASSPTPVDAESAPAAVPVQSPAADAAAPA
jgi:nitroimidazol reductase NimA-like FMN-containing flavoprotein (pyridoxamine 5'-phosphate oxidase superfamily)